MRTVFTGDAALTCVEFCHVPNATELLAIGAGVRLTLVKVTIEPVSVTEVCVFHHGATANTVAWSPLTKKNTRLIVATGGSDSRVRLFSTDLAAHVEERVFAGHTDAVTAITFDATGGLVLSGSRDGTARLWGVESGQAVRHIACSSDVVHVQWCPAGSAEFCVAERRGVVLFYEQSTVSPLRAVQLIDAGALVAAAWAPTSTALVAGLGDNGRVHLWHRERSCLPIGNATEPPSGAAGAGVLVFARTAPILGSLLVVSGKNELKMLHVLPGDTGATCVLVEVEGTAAAATWHAAMPVCAAAVGNSLVFLTAET